jgi:transposase-like protein
MGQTRRKFTKEFKLAAVRRLEQGISVGEASRALEVDANVLHRWRKEFRQGAGNVFPGNGRARWSEGRIAELERRAQNKLLDTPCAGAQDRLRLRLSKRRTSLSGPATHA